MIHSETLSYTHRGLVLVSTSAAAHLRSADSLANSIEHDYVPICRGGIYRGETSNVGIGYACLIRACNLVSGDDLEGGRVIKADQKPGIEPVYRYCHFYWLKLLIVILLLQASGTSRALIVGGKWYTNFYCLIGISSLSFFRNSNGF